MRESLPQKKARRHSLFVNIMRVLLPLIGVTILAGMTALIVLFNYLNDLGIGTISFSSDGLIMDRPELSGHDGERSYKVSALRAIQRLSDPRIIDLEGIEANIVLGEEKNALVTSKRGIYDKGKESLFLYEGVNVDWSEGYKVDLVDVTVNLANGAMQTSNKIQISSEKGNLTSGNMDYDQDLGIVRFTEGVKMMLRGGGSGI